MGMEFPENRLPEADNSYRTPDCGGERREPAADGGFFCATAFSRWSVWRMTEIWTLAALWLGLALLATLLSIWLRIATALSEIVVGTIAQLVIGAIIGAAVLGTDQTWVKFLSGTGAILLTFLAGAELDPVVFRERWKEAGAVGVISFLVPFIGCAAAARYLLGWDPMASWLAGVAMSTTSVAVVYAVMLEFGFNATNYGKWFSPRAS